MEFSLVEFLSSIGAFFLIWFVLSNFVFKYFFQLLADREAAVAGNEHLAEEKKASSKKIAEEIDQQLTRSRAQYYSAREEQIKVATKQAHELIGEATAKAQVQIASTEKTIHELKKVAASELDTEAKKVSKNILNKVLSSSSNITIH
ncbi:MAG: ATP synthase F0 subunit B [Proteobacteria bacterium]|nr:ATP synthase F0 subunit B [Pseudomonadota bacterium]